MIEAIALIMLAALTLYAVLGGADFGGGVWDLLASGPRKQAQRALITKAMAPVWEANHIWLILLIVVLFTAFPRAFAEIMTALHAPLTLMLLGIVLRGSAFVFRQYGGGGERAQNRWGTVFAVSSTITPVFLGACLGAMSTGGPWLSVFPLCVGLFALALFAMVAAVFLTLEDEACSADFRLRAIGAALIAAALAAVTAIVSPTRLDIAPAAVASFALGGGLLGALWLRRYVLARALAVGLVAVVIAGWAFSRYPVLLAPSLTLHATAAPAATLRLLLPTLALGALVLFPSLYWLMRVFKSRAG